MLFISLNTQIYKYSIVLTGDRFLLQPLVQCPKIEVNNEAKYIFELPWHLDSGCEVFTTLAVLPGFVAIFGTVHQEDEGAHTHLFQLIILAQVPIVAYHRVGFAIFFSR